MSISFDEFAVGIDTSIDGSYRDAVGNSRSGPPADPVRPLLMEQGSSSVRRAGRFLLPARSARAPAPRRDRTRAGSDGRTATAGRKGAWALACLGPRGRSSAPRAIRKPWPCNTRIRSSPGPWLAAGTRKRVAPERRGNDAGGHGAGPISRFGCSESCCSGPARADMGSAKRADRTRNNTIAQ